MEGPITWVVWGCLFVLSALQGSHSLDLLANCRTPLGMQSGAIPDGSLTASSAFRRDFNTYGPQRARLHLKDHPPGYRADRRSNGSTPASSNETWIMVKLSNSTVVTGISTQGYGDENQAEWITKYSFMFSLGSEFVHFRETSGDIKNFTGNVDSDSVRHTDVPLPVITSRVMLRPLAWNNNVGLRMELYGCLPGYYFLALLEIRGEIFTLPLVDDTNEDHQNWAADTTDQVQELLGKTPGFLMVKFRRFRLGRFGDFGPIVTAEVEIHCIKEASTLIARRLNESIEAGDSMFSSHVNTTYPSNTACSFPIVDIHLNETIEGAARVLTTSSLTIRADVTFCGSKVDTIEPEWEMSMVHDGAISPFLKIGNGTEHTLNPRICYGCYPVLIYLRFTTRIKQFSEMLLQDFGLVQIVQPPLVAKIRGVTEVAKGTGKVVLNASESFDPDVDSDGVLTFEWLCRRKKELFFDRNCRHVRTVSEGRILLVNVNRLKSKHSYDFKLVMKKGSRETTAVHEIKIIPSVVFYFSCVRNCGKKLTQSKSMKVTPECEGKLCKSIIRINWNVYMLAHSGTRQWKKIHSLSKSTSAGRSFVLGQGLPNYDARQTRNAPYKLKGTIEIQAKGDVIEEEHEMELIQNSVPFVTNSSGGCFVDPAKGFAVTTSFNISCTGWRDEDEPLRYEFRYRTVSSGVVINHPNTGISTLTTNLPVGDELHEHEFPVEIHVIDSLGDFANTTLKVKVRDKGDVDVRKTLQRIANKENNKYSNYIKDGEYEKATSVAISVLSLVEQRRRSNGSAGGAKGKYNIPKEKARKLKDNIIDEMTKIRINSKELITKVSTVVAMATKERDEISQESQEKAVHLLEQATDFLATLIANNTENEITVTAVSSNLLLGLGNILKISSEDASVQPLGGFIPGQTDAYVVDKKKSKQIARKALKAIWKLRDYLTVSVTDDEPRVIASKFISLVLYKQANLGPPEERTTVIPITRAENFTLPNFDALFREKRGVNKTDTTSKIVLFRINPYTWHKSAREVRSFVIDAVLQASNKTNLRVSGLDEPVQLFIPQNPERNSPSAVRNNTSHYFVRPSYEIDEIKLVQYHKIDIPHDRAVAFVRIKPEIPAPLRVYVAFADYPTSSQHNFTAFLPDYSTCRKEGELECDPYMLSFTSSDTGNVGTHYIGIHYYIERAYDKPSTNETDDNSSSNERTKRSCGGGSGRQKRSCIGVKDPPPPPTPAPVTLKSEYNASTDMNYTFFVTVGSCLYWSEEKESWTDEGCKVSPDIVSGYVKCLCNHLSAFGGDFFVAPNEIDFKMVFSKFGDLGETKNFVVLTTVCSILALYVVGIVFTRRSDKKDKSKTIPNVYLPDGGQHGGHHYQISVQTGLWVGSGTTANIGLILYGEDYHSEPIILNDAAYNKQFFARASVNTFTVSLPKSLGPLYKIRVWHDNSGESPGWFLQDVVITDITSSHVTHFIANRWLAVEKASGEVDLELKTANKKETSKFKNLFCSRASKRLADGHLWISVLARSPQSSFTRTQRLSCCISVLFLAMVTNAMFYKFGNEPKDTFKIGPLSMSLTQVKIGIQSAFIALPLNVIIVTIFRNVKPKRSKRQSNKDNEQTENATKGLPHFVVYIAWILCILAILTAAFFTVLYSMVWGTKVSNDWLTSILVSFLQDVVVLQPIQVVLISSLLSLVIRKPIKHDPVHGMPRRKTACAEDWKVQPPQDTELNTSRKFRVKLQKMFRSAVEISLFFVFIILLFVVCYGNRSSARYNLTKSLKEIFITFDKRVNNTVGFWNWTRQKLVPGLYLSEWYNGEPVNLEEGFLSSGYPFLVGMPRLRQLRVRPVPCQVTDIIEVERCMPYYSRYLEERAPYNLPGWTPIDNISAFETSFELDDLCPKPWRYRTAEDIQSLSFNGFYAVYDGGGYIADLGYNAESALEVIDDLEETNWIDERTFAVFIEFTVFEPSSTLFSTGKYLYERFPTGGTKTTGRIETLMIYYPTDPDFSSFYQVCQLLLLLLVFILFVVEIVKLYHQGSKYFVHFWNIVEFFQIFGAVAAMVLYFFKAKYTSDFVRRVRANPFQTSSSDYIVLWSDLEIWLLSFVVFLVTIKSLRLLKFNRHICHLTHTLKTATRHLVSYSVVFTATLLAYTQLGTLFFGSKVGSYANLVQSLRMLLQKLLGSNMYTEELDELNDIAGHIFTVAYSLSIAMILFNMFLSILNSSYSDVRVTKQGRFADVELAEFSLRYIKQKAASVWDDMRNAVTNANKSRRTRLKRTKEKYFRVPLSELPDYSDTFFCTKYDSSKKISKGQSTELCHCLSADQIQFQEASFEDLDDIDFVDEFTAMKDVKKTIMEIGTAFFLTKNQWSSTNLDNDQDDRDDASSLKSERSFSMGSNPSYLSISELSFGMADGFGNCDDLGECACMGHPLVDPCCPSSTTPLKEQVSFTVEIP